MDICFRAVNGYRKSYRNTITLCEVGESKPITALLGNEEKLVGFAADGTSFVTALREYQLINGRHELKFQTLVKEPGKFGALPGVALWESELLRAVKLDEAETYGYAFTPDLKTYRTVAEEHNTSGQVAKLVALEVDASTGKARPLVTPTEHGAYALSPNGKRLAVCGSTATQVVVYDLDRGKAISTHTFKNESDPKRPQPKPNQQPSLAFSQDGKQLVVSHGVSSTVLDADTGKEVPELEGVRELEFYLDGNPFGARGRLFGARCGAGTSKMVPDALAGVQNQGIWNPTGAVLSIWNTQTGKALKTWNTRKWVKVALCPTRPLLAVFEDGIEAETRLGFWEFKPEAAK